MRSSAATELSERTLIAFGGAAPLHAARLAEKLGIASVLIPASAGVGSAVGFLLAPVAYEVVRSRSLRSTRPMTPASPRCCSPRCGGKRRAFCWRDPGTELIETRSAEMRYRGQGHELTVTLPAGAEVPPSAERMKALFEAAYETTFGRLIPGLDVEVTNWMLRLAVPQPEPETLPPAALTRQVESEHRQTVFDPASNASIEVPVFWRPDLGPGDGFAGPALLAEPQTTTFVTRGYQAVLDARGNVLMERR